MEGECLVQDIEVNEATAFKQCPKLQQESQFKRLDRERKQSKTQKNQKLEPLCNEQL